MAREHGAKIFHCTSEVRSKGAALEQFFDATFANNDVFDAFCVFDADNLVDPNFFSAMNNALCDGEKLLRATATAKTRQIPGSRAVSPFLLDFNRFMNLANRALAGLRL